MKTPVAGWTAPGFESVRECFEENWQRIEVGASFAVVHQGKLIIDLWGGWMDRRCETPWQENTLVNLYSCTKGMAAIVMAILHDKEQLDFDAAVTEYWPEFGAEGKQNVTVAQLLSHQAGLAGVNESLDITDLYNWQKMIDLLAAQKPLWQPGTACGYHALTWGYFPGELCRRITGLSLGQYFQQYVAKPLNADIHIGLPDTEHWRVAEMIGPNHARTSPLSSSGRDETPPFYAIAQQNPSIRPFTDASSADWRRAEIAASNGHGHARALATIYGDLAANMTLMRPAALASVTAEYVGEGTDLVLGQGMRRSKAGFILNTRQCYGPGRNAFGHAGAGGSTGFADPERQLGVGYAMNQMENDSSQPSRSGLLIRSLYQCLAQPN